MSTVRQPDNKRIAKNAILLYLRMGLTMIVGLYTSRVVLATLGVEDYGVYGVVGGIVAMMGFLNAAMSGATSRFLTFELGKNAYENLRKTFSTVFYIHVLIAIIIFVLAETIGLWFLCNKLVIPEGRMYAAHWVYQLSILSAIITITQVPYNSAIIAHEKMDVYAYVEILNVSLKLLIVYLLVIGNFDKLIVYAILMALVSLIVMMVYRVYCIRKFSESHLLLIWDKRLVVKMLSYSGWNLYGNLSVTVRQQGINFIINMFFGPILNAAANVATTIQGMVLMLGHNIITAYSPQIVKLYAAENKEAMINLTFQACKNSAILILCCTIPLYLEMDFLMGLWLKEVPDHAVEFCQMLLVSGVLNIMFCVFNAAISATGKIKNLSFITGTIYLLNLPAIYLLFRLNMDSIAAYYIMVLTNVIILIVNYWILHNNMKEFTAGMFVKNIGSVLIVAILSCVLPLYIHMAFETGFVRVILTTIAAIVSIAATAYLFAFDQQTKNYIKRKLQSFIHKS